MTETFWKVVSTCATIDSIVVIGVLLHCVQLGSHIDKHAI